jgi:hypothetical protein
VTSLFFCGLYGHSSYHFHLGWIFFIHISKRIHSFCLRIFSLKLYKIFPYFASNVCKISSYPSFKICDMVICIFVFLAYLLRLTNFTDLLNKASFVLIFILYINFISLFSDLYCLFPSTYFQFNLFLFFPNCMRWDLRSVILDLLLFLT